MKDKIKGMTWAIHINGSLVEDDGIHQGTLIYLSDIISVLKEEIEKRKRKVYDDFDDGFNAGLNNILKSLEGEE